jgi:hypothetical protein
MKHALVETNWVVGYAAPSHLRLPTALALAQRAKSGDLQIHIPAVCLIEARYPIRTKYQPRLAANSVRKYLAWATKEGMLSTEESSTVRQVLDRYEAVVLAELDHVDERIGSLRNHPGIDVFPLTDEMLAQAVELSVQNLDLKPFDQAILAAVLVRARALRESGSDDIVFCELDGDLQPWDSNGGSKQPLTSLYDAAGVRVHADFAMGSPPRRHGFPEP